MGEPLILLGAGASVDANLPTSEGLTAKMLEHFAGIPRRSSEDMREPAFRFVHHMTEANRAARGEGGGVDIERLFAAVDLLASLDESPLTPFVERWHGGLDLLTSGRGWASTSAFERVFKRAVSEAAMGNGFGISDLGGLLQTPPTDGIPRLFSRIRSEMLSCIPDQLTIMDDCDLSYLQPLVDSRCTIASLNYDLTIETAARRSDTPLSTGVEKWEETDALEWCGSDGVDLLKLHGSVSWSVNDDGGAFTTERASDQRRRPCIVFGEGNKLNAQGPYLALFAEFKARLAAADSVLIVGYSFRDGHVNAVLKRWVTRKPEARIIVLSPSIQERAIDWSETPSAECLRALRRPDQTGEPHGFSVVKSTTREGLAHALQLARADAG